MATIIMRFAFACSLLAACSSVVAATAQSHLDEVSPTNICDSVKQYSGYYTLTTGTAKAAKHYFYWMFEARTNPETAPVVLWMTGGPGCSSAVALFGENGPCHVTDDGTATTPNKFSWNTNANIIYIDQPAGTGFSYGLGMDHNESMVAADMYDFLQQFMAAHPQYSKLPFFTFGESYAGHYVPAVTHKIWEENQKPLAPGKTHIQLEGTAIGNGLVDPLTQFRYYAEMAVSTNDHAPAVSNLTHALMVSGIAPCIAAIKACQKAPATCILAIDTCNIGQLIPYTLSGMNPYDMRVKCAKPPLCYDFSNVKTFLERTDVKAAIGVPADRHWADCNRAVALSFECVKRPRS